MTLVFGIVLVWKRKSVLTGTQASARNCALNTDASILTDGNCTSTACIGFISIYLKNQTTGSETISLLYHRFMADVVPAMSVSSWLKLSLRERYQYTYRMARHDIDAQHEHHLRSRIKAVMATAQSKWKPFTSAEMFNNMGEGFTIDEIRMTVGTEHRFNLCHSCCRIPS